MLPTKIQGGIQCGTLLVFKAHWGRSVLTTSFSKCAKELGMHDMRELGDRGQSEREIGGSFTEAEMRIALKDIKFFSKCTERKTPFYEEGRVCGREVNMKC